MSTEPEPKIIGNVGAKNPIPAKLDAQSQIHLKELFGLKRQFNQVMGEATASLTESLSEIMSSIGTQMVNMQRTINELTMVNITLKKEKEQFEKALGVKATESQATAIQTKNLKEEISILKKGKK